MRQLNRINLHFFFISLIISIFGLAWFLQSQLFINHDVSWLLEASNRLMMGGTYSNNFFENNPPLILYLYFPPVIMAKIFSINIILAFRIYIFFLTLASLSLCYYFIRAIFSKTDISIARVFTIVLTVLFLLFPVYDFGQREHLLIILTMPYLLLVAYRLQGNQTKLPLAIVCGVLAGLGFAIKPYFLFTLILIELYYVICKKNIFASLRAETLSIMTVLILYAALLLMYHSDYLFIVAPFALRWCYLGTQETFYTLITDDAVIFCLLAVMFYLFQYAKNTYRILSTVLLLSLSGFLLSHLLQQTIYSYHVLPALSMAILLFSLLLSLCFTQSFKRQDYSKFIAATLVILAFLYHNEFALFTVLTFQPRSYFIFFSSLFIVSLYLIYNKENAYVAFKITSSTCFIVLAGYVFSYMASRTDWHAHTFAATTVLLILLFGLITPQPKKSAYQSLLVTAGSIFIFAFPSFYAYNFYNNQLFSQAKHKGIVTFLRAHAAHHSVYFLTTAWLYPATQQAGNITYASRFSAFWMLPALIKSSYLPNANHNEQQKRTDERFLIDMIADDLDTNKPDFVFVDTNRLKYNLSFLKKKDEHRNTLEAIPFDYLTYFSNNAHFKAAWKPYHPMTAFKVNSLFSPDPALQFEVYSRHQERL